MTDSIKTPPTLEYLYAHREQILAIAEQYGAYNVRVFGSVARGEATLDSDVDFLVSYRVGTSLWDAVGLWQDLQELLKCDVSIISDDTSTVSERRKRLLQRIEADTILL